MNLVVNNTVNLLELVVVEGDSLELILNNPPVLTLELNTCGEGGGGIVINGIPEGGTTGQVLAKASDTDYDTEWVDQQGGGGTGTVTSVSVVTNNGFLGTVENPTTTPAITISTTVTGMVKGNGTAISAAVANVDYATPAYVDAKVENQIVDGVIDIAPSQNAVFDADKNLQDQIDNIVAGSVVSVIGTTPIQVDNTDPQNPVVEIQQANTTDDGYLSAIDWNIFNSKQNAITPAALTKSDDTNVTLSLGGTPATALLQATSLTLGWSGQLAISRGGTGQSTALSAFNALSPLTTLGDTLYHNGTDNVRLAGQTTINKQFLSQTGNGAISAAPVWASITAADIGSGEALTKVDDTNVTLTLGGTPATSLLKATSLTLGWTGVLSTARGGSGSSNFTTAVTNITDLLYDPLGTAAILSSYKFTKGGDAEGTALSLGTNDNFDLTFRTNNTVRFTLDSSTGYLRRGTGNPYFGFQLYGTGAGSVITFGDTLDSTTPYVCVREYNGTDTDQIEAYGQKGAGLRAGTFGSTTPQVWVTQAGAVCINTMTAVSGAELTVAGDVDISSTLNVQGISTFQLSAVFNSFVKHKTASTPSSPANGTEFNLYYKSNKFIIQYNDGGTVRYKYLDLTGTGVTWVQTTTPP